MNTKPKLLISNGGEICCEQHAPYRGSDSWCTGDWKPMRLNERVEFAAELGFDPQCETCVAIERNAKAVKP